MIHLPFNHAIARFACLLPKGEKIPRLVFASVEMLPCDRPVPDKTPLNASGYPPGLPTKAGRLSFRRVALTAQAALDWYCRLDTLPDATGPHVGQQLNHARLVDEPAWTDDLWPSLVVPIHPPLHPGPMEDERIDPFSGASREVLRVHRRLSTGDAAVEALDALSDALEWLRLRVWVDFALYPELLGSAALVVPDPEVRSVRPRLDRDDEGKEAILVKVEGRDGPLQDLSLSLREERHGGVAWTDCVDVPSDGRVRVLRPQPIREIGCDLVHPVRGTIASATPIGFIRTFGGDMAVLGREVRLQSRDGRKKSAPESERTVRDASRETISTGTPLPLPGRMAEGRERRNIARVRDLEVWLEDPTETRDRLWEMIGGAREDVLLVDPYADGLDLQDYGMGSSGARVRLLTAGKTSGQRATVTLETGLAAMAEAGKMAEARVIPASALHDRFFVLDGTVWSLGSSLNGLGREATMLIRLREPRPVREHLERLWKDARIVTVAP